MRCTSPLTVGFYDDGKTLCWSQKHYSKQYPTFQLPCGKCISCRLETAKQTAIRCVHEAQMHDRNCFITLTYSDENLTSPKLQYRDFQLFTKRLRKYIYESEPDENHKISILVTGEYGDKTKRPHWHALIFNWEPSDKKLLRSTDRGDKVYTSETLERLWPFGLSEIGQITLESAGYVARYATKKLTHGKDGEHDYEPISRRSSKNAIGKSWIEKHWKYVFSHGRIVLPNGSLCGIPRYYEKWLLKHHPTEWAHYVTQTKQKIIDKAVEKEKQDSIEYKKERLKLAQLTGLLNKPSYPAITKNKMRAKILKQKFKLLTKFHKL